METGTEKGTGAGSGEVEEEVEVKATDPDEDEAGARYTGPERRAQGYLIAEVVEGPEQDAPTRPSDFTA
jgi:hypothetical protein